MKNSYLNFAKNLARQGGALLKEKFESLSATDIHAKGSHDVVTEADMAIEALYAEAIRVAFPDHGIIGEEGTSDKPDAEHVWVLDPLDGTKNFSMGNPFFCTTITLLKKQDPVMTVIYEPITDRLYSAAKGEGAFLNNQPIHTSAQTDLKQSMLLYCHAATEDSIRRSEAMATTLKLATRDAARLRSAGCEMALVARGSAEAYFMDGLPLWDMAGGALLVREAGGRATTLNGDEWKPGDTTILVSNGTDLHPKILERLGGLFG